MDQPAFDFSKNDLKNCFMVPTDVRCPDYYEFRHNFVIKSLLKKLNWLKSLCRKSVTFKLLVLKFCLLFVAGQNLFRAMRNVITGEMAHICFHLKCNSCLLLERQIYAVCNLYHFPSNSFRCFQILLACNDIFVYLCTRQTIMICVSLYKTDF